MLAFMFCSDSNEASWHVVWAHSSRSSLQSKPSISLVRDVARRNATWTCCATHYKVCAEQEFGQQWMEFFLSGG